MLAKDKPQAIQDLNVNLYLTIYALFLVKTILDTTMFHIPWPSATLSYLFLLAFIFIGAKMLLIDKPHSKELWAYIFLIFCFLGTFIHTGYLSLAAVLILILGAKNVPFERLIQVYCWIAGIIILITMVSSQLGLVENLVYVRGTTSRISFGFNYPTDFTAHIFYFVMGYCYLRRTRLTYPELAAILGLSIFSLIFCDARTNAICLLLAFLVFLYFRIRHSTSEKSGNQYTINPIFSQLLTFSMPLCASFIIGLTFLYHNQPDNVVLSTINDLLSGRLHWGSVGLERYGIHLFGSAFEMVGWGGKLGRPAELYFFLDSSYVLILIRYGIMMFLAVMAIFIASSRRAEKRKDIYLMWILALIFLQCMFEHHMLEIAYNPFLFFVFAKQAQGGDENLSRQSFPG